VSDHARGPVSEDRDCVREQISGHAIKIHPSTLKDIWLTFKDIFVWKFAGNLACLGKSVDKCPVQGHVTCPGKM
jgi:hypothetical protein